MGVNVKAAVGVAAGMTAAGAGISWFAGSKMDEIRERGRPDREWAQEANLHFSGVGEDGVSAEEIQDAAEYVREHDMPDGVQQHISSYGITFSQKYGDDQSNLTALAGLPALAIVGGGFTLMTGAILALTQGGTTGLTSGHGIAVAAAGAGLLGGYVATELLRR